MSSAPTTHVLVVDDEESMREFLQLRLEREGYRLSLAASGDAAIEMLQTGTHHFDLVITDLTMPGKGGLEVLKAARDLDAPPAVIVMTAFASTGTAVEAMKLGAYDYQVKPFKTDEFTLVIERALEERALRSENRALKNRLRGVEQIDNLLAKSRSMQRIFELILKVAPTRTNVLITGESGTGKELVARSLHSQSDRQDGPFMAINCAAIPEQLIESELFGHAKGAFTGAHRESDGLFRACHGGTLFLDEIGELATSTQVKLLRVLQERTVRPVGSTETFEVDCRVVAATNQNLERAVQEGTFRNDLFFRLNVVRIELPPLRARKEDIPVLADTFFERYNREQGSRLERLSPEAYQVLHRYDYPGNVRELENIIERAVTLASGPLVTAEHMPNTEDVPHDPMADEAFSPAGMDLDRWLADAEQRFVRQAMLHAGGAKSRAAELLNISQRSLRYRLQKMEQGDGEP